MKDQKYRSSGNFSTSVVPPGYTQLYWEIQHQENPSAITFTVKQDKSDDEDPTIFSNLTNGSVTKIEKHRSLYIASPKNADGDFLVLAYAQA
jgi:hypothetical protein